MKQRNVHKGFIGGNLLLTRQVLQWGQQWLAFLFASFTSRVLWQACKDERIFCTTLFTYPLFISPRSKANSVVPRRSCTAATKGDVTKSLSSELFAFCIRLGLSTWQQQRMCEVHCLLLNSTAQLMTYCVKHTRTVIASHGHRGLQGRTLSSAG